MFELKINNEDKKWLQKNYPELKIKTGGNCSKISGILQIDMVFYGNEKPYVIKPEKKHLSNGVRIKDEYQIEIIFRGSEHSNLPQVYERGSRLETVAKQRNLKLEDLHINPSSAVCLCIKGEENGNFPNGFNLRDFFNNLVIPFFYSQSYFEKNNLWPWGQYNHGMLGLLEWYATQQQSTRDKVEKLIKQLSKYQMWQECRQRLVQKSKIKGHHLCICGSSEKFRSCHKQVFSGLWKLKQDVGKFHAKI